MIEHAKVGGSRRGDTTPSCASGPGARPWRSAALLVALVSLLGGRSPAWGQAASSGRLSRIVKKTEVHSPPRGELIDPILKGLDVHPGYVLATDDTGRAALVFSHYGQVKMNTNTILDVLVPSRPNQPILHLRQGTVGVATYGVQRVPFIEGPAAKIQDLGTEILLSVDPADGTTTLTVIKGQARFYNDLDSVIVAEKQQSRARPGGPPSAPEAVADPSQLTIWEASVESLSVPIEVPLTRPGADLERLKSAVDRNPTDADARVAWADALQDAGRFDEARKAYGGALDRQQGHFVARAHLAQLDLREGKLEDAVTAFKELDAGAPASPEGPVGLAMAAFSHGDVDAASKYLDQAAARAPGDARVLTFQGLAHMRRYELEEAKAAFDHASDLDLGFAPVHAYRSYLLTLQNDVTGAEKAAEEAIRLAPRSSLTLLAWANALFYAGKTGEAAAAIEGALKVNPVSAPAWLTKAKILVAQDRLAEGVRAARQAVALDPRDPVGYTTLGVMLLARNDPEGAERMFQEALERAPELAAAQTGLAQVAIQRGQFNQALDRQQAALGLDRANTAAALNNLGAIYLARGRLKSAHLALQHAGEAQPKWKLPLGNLAQIYLEQNRYAEALEAAEDAVRGGENSATLRTTLARVFQRLGRTDRALTELQQAEALDPDYPQAQFQLSRLYLDQGRARDALRAILHATSVHPGSMVESRLYARTEATLAFGSLDVSARTDGRADRGQWSYFTSGNHMQADNDRENADERASFGLGLAGYERSPAHQWVLYGTWLDRTNGRPGREVQGHSEDTNFRSAFDGWETHLIHRLSTGLRSHLTLKLGFRTSDLLDRNPDSLLPTPSSSDPLTARDQKPFSRLHSRSEQRLVEVRWDARSASRDTLTAGFAWTAEEQRLDGLRGVVTPGPQGPVVTPTPTAVRDDPIRRTLYAEGTHRAGGRLDLRLGGYWDQSSGIDGLARVKLVARYRPVGRTYLVFLAYPSFGSDATELSPVEAWSQPFGFDRVNFAKDGWAMSYELHYQRPASRLSLLTISAFTRDAHGLLLDLEDPRFAPTPNLLPVARARVSGAQAAFEHQVGQRWTARVFAQYQDTRDRGSHADLPYFARRQGGVRLDYLDRAGWQGFLSWTGVSTRSTGLANRPRVPGYNLMDLRIARQLDLRRNLFVHIRNVLNRSYESFSAYPGAPREVVGGVQYRF